MIDVSNLADRPADGTFDLEAYERSIQDKNVPNHGKVYKKKHNSDDEDMAEEKKDTGNDWSDVDSDGDDSDDMDSDSDNENNNHKKKDSKLNPKGNSVGLSKKMLDKEKAKDFFRDM